MPYRSPPLLAMNVGGIKGSPPPSLNIYTNYNKQQHNDFKQRLQRIKMEEDKNIQARTFKLKRIYLVYLIILICIGKGLLLVNFHEVQSIFITSIRSAQSSVITKTKPVPVVSSSIPIYYINLEASQERRTYLENHLKEMNLEGRRVRAFTPEDVQARVEKKIVSVQSIIKPNENEIACIASHLIAIYRAVHDPQFLSSSPYALILEDDVQFEFDVDFNGLVSSAPKDFAVLQLMTSNAEQSKNMFNYYKFFVDQLEIAKKNEEHSSTEQSKESTPSLRGNKKSMQTATTAVEIKTPIRDETLNLWKNHAAGEDLWSTQAYMINKAAVREFIDSVVTLDDMNMPRVRLSQPSSISPKCVGNNACLFPYRIVADIYLYIALGKTYMSRIPLLNGGHDVGYVSTIQTTPGGTVDEANKNAFQTLAGIVREAKDKAATVLPSFITLKASDRPPVVVVEPEVVKVDKTNVIWLDLLSALKSVGLM